MQDTVGKGRCCPALCNNGNTELFEVDVPSCEVRVQFDKHILSVKYTAGLTVDLPVCPQDRDMKAINVCWSRRRVGFALGVYGVLPLLVYLVSFCHHFLGGVIRLLDNILDLLVLGSAWCVWLKVSSHKSDHESRQRVARTEVYPLFKSARVDAEFTR